MEREGRRIMAWRGRVNCWQGCRCVRMKSEGRQWVEIYREMKFEMMGKRWRFWS